MRVKTYRVVRFFEGVQRLIEVAGFRPGERATFVSAKVAKTIDAQSGQIKRDERK